VSDFVHKTHHAGEPITDLCRACKVERNHTVIAVDGEGRAARVVCDFCGSQHNYRGGGDEPRPASAPAPPAAAPRLLREHEERAPVTTIETSHDLESLLRRVLREELGLTPGTPAPKWRGGRMVLRPGKPGLQEKEWPVDALFHKIVMIRNRLRTLEQQLNAADIPEDLKLRLQAYVTSCYGSLTSFNVLFADEADQFRGSGGAD
jgi:AraC-like DNA-binding protein